MSEAPSPEFHTVRGYQLKNKTGSGLTPALEDYLEMVYRLCLEEKYTRVSKLSERLHVRPSSASKMILKLVELGYLKYDSYESILLTETGRTAGAYLLERHNIIEHFFLLLGSDNPLEETELVEHVISASTVLKIEALLSFMQNPDIQKQYKSLRDAAISPELTALTAVEKGGF